MAYNKKSVFLWLILLQPILDVIAYFQYNNVIGSIAGYSRLLIMIILPTYIIIKTSKKRSFIISMGVIAVFSFFHILNGFRVGYISIFEDIAYLLRVIQMPVLTISFIYFINGDESFMDTSAKGYFINCFIIFIIIIISTLTHTNETTYGELGLLGWFGNTNSQSIIVTCVVPMALYYLLKTKKLYLFVCGIIVTTFLLLSNGTKGAYYSIFLIYGGFIIFYIIEAIANKKKPDHFHVLTIGIFLIMSIASVLLYPYTPRYTLDNAYSTARELEVEEMDKELDVRKTESGEVFNALDPETYAQLVKYYEPRFNQGLVKKFGIDRVLKAYNYLPDPYIVSDNRLVKRMYAQFIWEDSDFLTKLVGFEYSKIDDYDLENDFPAIYYYYGYIGITLYVGFILFFFMCILIRVAKGFKSALTTRNFTLLVTLCLLLGLAQYSGALLRRPNGSIYLSIILALIYVECNQPIKKVDENKS